MLQPKKIVLHQKTQTLELHYASGAYSLSAEFLRVYSPSAEVRGHGAAKKNWPTDKAQVRILSIEAQGNYAIKLLFDDGHASGIYSWRYLHELATNQESLWQTYLREIKLLAQQNNGESVLRWT